MKLRLLYFLLFLNVFNVAHPTTQKIALESLEFDDIYKLLRYENVDRRFCIAYIRELNASLKAHLGKKNSNISPSQKNQ
jgi:hypothetical protein